MSLIYLDSVIVIYAVEKTPLFAPRAQARVASLRAAGDRMAVSDLTRVECRVKRLRLGDAATLADFDRFLMAPDVLWVPLPPVVFERAAHIRARYNYKLGDALHLAAAVAAGCDAFLTNDLRLAGFSELRIEVLP